MTSPIRRIHRSLARLRNNVRQFGLRYLGVQVANTLLYLLGLPKRLLVTAWRRAVVPLFRRLGLTRALRSFLPAGGRVRRYVNGSLGVAAAFEELDRRGVRYVILRWFEDFPAWPEGEDLDLLVDDGDLKKLDGVLVIRPSRHPVDVYTVSARNGWHGLPYYPPHIARAMLSRRRAWNGCFVPCPQDHFLSLCYHVVYHKAETSGLPVHRADCQRGTVSETRYASVLRRLGAEADREVSACLEDLRALLDSEGWSPPLDTLRKLAQRSEWLASLLPRQATAPQDGELMVFVVRKALVQHGLWDEVVRRIGRRESGLDVLWSGLLDAEEQAKATERIRGGEWGKGPFPSSGGPPAAVIVAFDYHPLPVAPRRMTTHPHVRNERVFLKEKVRDEVNRLLLRPRWVNSIHSSDDEIEAWEYLERIFQSERVEQLREEVQHRREAYRTPQRVVQVLETNRTRGKVELVEWDGGLAVRKTYKVGRERFAARERLAYGELSARHPAIPPLLEGGPNHVVIPFYDDALRGKSDLERARALRQRRDEVLDFLFFLYTEGYFLIDFAPRQVLIDAQGVLRVVDFEFLYPYEHKPASFLESYDIAGVPRDFAGDLPRGHKARRSYRSQWRGILDVDLRRDAGCRRRYGLAGRGGGGAR